MTRRSERSYTHMEIIGALNKLKLLVDQLEEALQCQYDRVRMLEKALHKEVS